MATAAPPAAARAEDQRVPRHDVSWTDPELVSRIRGDRARVRVACLGGVLERMSPSVDHEGITRTIARLLEAYAGEQDLAFNGSGSWTLGNPRRARALEPDECYSLGPGRPTEPDLAIEVARTSGGIDKLEVDRGLGVLDVWFWREGAIEVHALSGDRHERSALLPDLDLVELARHIDPEHQTQAVRRYREALRRACAGPRARSAAASPERTESAMPTPR